MRIFQKTKRKETQQPHFTTTWNELSGKVHEIKIYGNADKISGFIYYRCVIDNGKTYTISKFDGEKWREVDGEESALSERLGMIVEQYDDLCAISEMIK